MHSNNPNNTECADHSKVCDDVYEQDRFYSLNSNWQEQQQQNEIKDGTEIDVKIGSNNGVNDKQMSDGISKLPLFMITVAISFAIAASACHDIIISQFLYNYFAKEILGNGSVDTSRHPCGNRSGNNSDLDDEVQHVQDKTSHLYLLLNMTSYGLGMFTNVLLGTYSIVLHRRAQILIPCCGYATRCTVLLIVAFWNLDANWLFLGFVCDGLCGTLAGIFLGTFLYSTDITPRNGKRTIGIAIIEGTKGAMSGSAKILTGFLLDKNDFILPSVVTVGLLFISILLMCGLPNHKPEMKITVAEKMSFRKAFYIMTSPFNTKNKEIRRMILLAMFSFFAIIVVLMGIDKIFSLFFMDFPFCWDALTIAWFSFSRDLGYNLFSAIGIPILYKYLPGLTIGILGLFLCMGSYVLYALAVTTLQAFMGAILSIGVGAPITLIRGETSKLLETDVQGPLFACFAVLESVSFFIGPIVFMNLYTASLNFYRGLSYFAACALLVLPLIAMIMHQITSVGYTRRNKFREIVAQRSNHKGHDNTTNINVS